jgi:hypothetical protein
MAGGVRVVEVERGGQVSAASADAEFTFELFRRPAGWRTGILRWVSHTLKLVIDRLRDSKRAGTRSRISWLDEERNRTFTQRIRAFDGDWCSTSAAIAFVERECPGSRAVGVASREAASVLGHFAGAGGCRIGVFRRGVACQERRGTESESRGLRPQCSGC